METELEIINDNKNPIRAKPKNKKKEIILSSIYSRCIVKRTISLPINVVGSNLKQVIEEFISFHYEGKCVVEGFIKPQSTKIITYSSGTIKRGNCVSFDIVFECQVCFPVEGTIISCIAKTNTKAGITAESADEKPSPIIVFIARDHHYYSSQFNDVKEGDKINIRVIGQRFELNDKFVSIIGELVREQKPKLVIEG
jgi:DNA-directed RNA polymerase subunit E'/Rpb7